MFSAAPQIVSAFAAGTLNVGFREAPLAEVERQWLATAPSGARLVFVM